MAASGQWRAGSPTALAALMHLTASRLNYGTRDFSIKILIYYILSVSNISAGKRVHKCSLYIFILSFGHGPPPPHVSGYRTLERRVRSKYREIIVQRIHTYIHIVIHYSFYNINTRAAARRQCAGRGGRARHACPCPRPVSVPFYTIYKSNYLF